MNVVCAMNGVYLSAGAEGLRLEPITILQNSPKEPLPRNYIGTYQKEEPHT